MQITATELKNRLGQYLDAAETSPVIVEKSGRIKSVLISNAMYEKFLAYEDAYWASKARVAEEEGYLGKKASEAMPLVQEHLDRCPPCREEYEVLLEALKALSE